MDTKSPCEVGCFYDRCSGAQDLHEGRSEIPPAPPLSPEERKIPRAVDPLARGSRPTTKRNLRWWPTSKDQPQKEVLDSKGDREDRIQGDDGWSVSDKFIISDNKIAELSWRARRDSNFRPSASKSRDHFNQNLPERAQSRWQSASCDDR